MNIGKLIAMAGIAAALSANAELEYLYWQVDLDANNPWSVPAFSYATLKDDTSTELSFYDTDGHEAGSKMLVNGWTTSSRTGNVAGPLYTGLTASSYEDEDTFLFELWRQDGSGNATKVGWANYTYGQLASYIYSDMSEGTGANALTVTAIPEPTGATLALFGLAVLALRRRRRGGLAELEA